jgi:hypothetical protein
LDAVRQLAGNGEIDDDEVLHVPFIVMKKLLLQT